MNVELNLRASTLFLDKLMWKEVFKYCQIVLAFFASFVYSFEKFGAALFWLLCGQFSLGWNGQREKLRKLLYL